MGCQSWQGADPFQWQNIPGEGGCQWQLGVHLPPTKAGGPYNMEISAGNKITLHDILFGDVLVLQCASRMMAHQLNIHDVIYAREIAEPERPADQAVPGTGWYRLIRPHP